MLKSDSELLATCLHISVDHAREMLAIAGGFRGLLKTDRQAVGLSKGKWETLLAFAEMEKRRGIEELKGMKSIIRDPEAVTDYFKATIMDLDRETFRVLCLNKANQVIGEIDLGMGTVDEMAIHPREIVKEALKMNATALILAHNHPSGRIEPSVEDRALTERVKSACTPLGIKILDHIIIGDNKHFSFQEGGL